MTPVAKYRLGFRLRALAPTFLNLGAELAFRCDALGHRLQRPALTKTTNLTHTARSKP